MAIYMKGKRKLMSGKPFVVLFFIITVLLVNKLLFTNWNQPGEKNEISFLPSDTFTNRETNRPMSNNISMLKDNLIRSDRNKKVTKADIENNNVPGISKGLIKEALDDYHLYLSDVKESDLQNKYVNKHKYKFTLNNEDACNGHVFVLILIHSSPKNTEERLAIRNTWGSVRYYSGATIVPLFLLAHVNQDSPVSQSDLVKESRTYKDIIQGNFIDSYKNLTHKNIMGLHWVQKHCYHTKFVLKTDDDTLINTYRLIKFLFQKSPDGNLDNFLYCSTFKLQGPRRDKPDKWYVSVEEYPYAKYPPYCEGFAYIMSRDVSTNLYEASAFVKPYWIDDVYVTGFLALKTGIYHKDMEHGHGYNLMYEKHLSKTVQSSMFILAKYKGMRKNWDRAWSDIKTIHRIV